MPTGVYERTSEHRAILSAAQTGKSHTQEARRNMSLAQNRRFNGSNGASERAKHAAAARRQFNGPDADKNRAKQAASARRQHGTPEDRFLQRVKKTRTHWWWLGGLCRGKTRGHRRSYELYVGPLIPGHHIHHTCGQKLCVNPAHLVQLTPDEHRKEHSR